MKNLVGLCLLLTAFIAVNAEDIPQDPVNIADEVEEDRDDIDDEDEEDRDDIDEEDEDEEDEEDRNELIDMNVEDRRIPAVGPTGIRCDAKALGRKIHTGTIRTNTALRCQELCGQWNIDHPDRPQCQVFTWRGRDYKAKWEKRRRCYFLTDLKQVKKRQYWCWGPGESIQTTPTPNECQTIFNKPCIFPFKLFGVSYNQCTADYSDNGAAWCATGVNDAGEMVYVFDGPNKGYMSEDCKEGCPGTDMTSTTTSTTTTTTTMTSTTPTMTG